MDNSHNVIWDKADALRRMGGKETRLSMMVGIFLEESEASLKRLQAAFEQQNSDEIHRASHALKGALGNLSAKTTYEISQAIEKYALENDVGAATLLWPVFQQEFSALKNHLALSLSPEAVVKNVDQQASVQGVIMKLSNSLSLGDYLTPGEIDALRRVVTNQETLLDIDKLAEQVADFNLDDALISLKNIAAKENVNL